MPAPHLEFRYPSGLKGPVLTVVVIAPAACQIKATGETAIVITKPDGKLDEITWSRDQLPIRRQL